MPPRSAEQLQLALNAPPRPDIADCDVCAQCPGGTCARWRERQRDWVQTWQGKPPPESSARWGDWWKGVKTQHAKLVAAAEAEQAARAQEDTGAVGNAAGKRRAQSDSTPNKGGQRKDAPATRERVGGEGNSAVHALMLPPSQVDSAEAAEVAEAIAVIRAVEIADAAEAAQHGGPTR